MFGGFRGRATGVVSVVAAVLLVVPAGAQRHGGHGGGSVPGAINRPTGVDEKDDLADFHRLMAMQASSRQIADYQAMLKSTEAAASELKVLQGLLGNGVSPEASERKTALVQAIEKARNASRAFVEGFSDAQRTGLKEISKKEAAADSELGQQAGKLAEAMQNPATAGEAAGRVDALDKALENFHEQELALGREMSIVLASGQDLVFMLPQTKSAASIDGKKVEVTSAGALSQIAAEGGQRRFKLELAADLTDLQQNVTELLRAQLDAAPACGERIAIRRATLEPAAPASLLNVQLHYERWSCRGGAATELAEADGSVELKLTGEVDPASGLKVTAITGRVNATGMLGEELRSGSLGDDLREKSAQTLLTAVYAGTDFKTTLPAAVSGLAAVREFKFQDEGAGRLSAAVQGEIAISDRQADELASQLNQALTVGGAAAR